MTGGESIDFLFDDKLKTSFGSLPAAVGDLSQNIINNDSDRVSPNSNNHTPYLAGDFWVPNNWASRATVELFRSAAVSIAAGGGRGGRPGKSAGGLIIRDWFTGNPLPTGDG